jgi:hypothetical protein
MAVELILNELSLAVNATTLLEARERMAGLVETIRQASKRGVPRAIRTEYGLHSILIAPHYPLQRWWNDADVDKEERRFFRTVASKAPLLENVPVLEERALGMECHHNGLNARGLLITYLLDGLALSLCSEPQWEEAYLDIVINELAETEIELIPDRLRHVSRPYHVVGVHDQWITQRTRLPDPRNGVELWQQAHNRYPHLIFCAHVEKQLQSYLTGNIGFTQLLRRLTMLNHYAATWQSEQFEPERVGCKVTPESPATLQQFGNERTFLCPDGEDRLFSWHVRMTPDERRLHFFPDQETRTIIIGYIGSHLPTALYH